MIKAVLFDMIGTTVQTDDHDFIENSIIKSFEHFGLVPNVQIIKNHRGKNKLDMIHAILKESGSTMQYSNDILLAFNNRLLSNIATFTEMHGFQEVCIFLKSKNISIGIGTGLSEEIATTIIKHLGWSQYPIDYQEVFENLGKSRPDPVMIYDMMHLLHISDPDTLLKVGDTVADIQEGKNASSLTAVILSGTQDRPTLLAAKPDFVLNELSDLIALDVF